MSGNAEIGRRFAAALAAGEVPEELLASDFVMETVSVPTIKRTYVGSAGVKQWIEDFLGVFAPESASYSAEVTDVSDTCVIAKISLEGKGRVSGAPLDLAHWGVAWIREGKIAKAVGYGTRREALHAAGLPE